MRTLAAATLAAATLAVSTVGAATVGACAAPLQGGRVIADPAGDDHGPGTYVYPLGEPYGPGALDLREVRLALDGDDLVVEVAFERSVAVARRVHLTRNEVDDLFVATVDVYLDLDRVPGQGATETLPGRRLRLPADAAWDVAVVLSPIPSRLRAVLGPTPTGTSVFVPEHVRVSGQRLRGRVPRAVLLGASLDRIAVGATVTGTVFATTFRTLLPGALPDAWTREVTREGGRCDRWEEELDGTPCTFGGCEGCGLHPRVLDALYPEPGVQERLLSDYDTAGGRLATLPMVLPEGGGTLEPAPVEPVTRPVRDRRGALVTVLLDGAVAPPEGAFAAGLDAAGAEVATLVVTAVPPGGPLILRVVEGDAAAIAVVRWQPTRSPDERPER